MWWAIHGCPPDPAPIPAPMRPCRVHWGVDEMTLTYDPDGRLRQVDVDGFTTTYRWDHGQLTSIDIDDKPQPDTIEVRHEPDATTYVSRIFDKDIEQRFALADGRPATLASEKGTWTWTYDHGRLTTLRSDYWSGETVFSYDSRGLLARHDDGREAWTYTWDEDGRLAAIGGWDRPVTVDYCDHQVTSRRRDFPLTFQ
jgi:YD repeat-containing protein